MSGVPRAQDQEFRQLAEEQSGTSYDRASGVGGTYTFTLKANVERTLREEAVKQALQTIERRVNELGVAEPIVALHGTAADQILVQLPGVTDVNRAKEIIRSTALLELKIVEEGPMPTKESLLQAHGGQVPVEHGRRAGPVRPARRRFGVLPGAEGGGHHGPRPAQRAAVARREQPPGGVLLPQQRRRRRSSAS